MHHHIINLNESWKYSAYFEEKMILNSYDSSKWKNIRIPHTNVELPYNYLDENTYQFVGCYKRSLRVERDWKGKHVILTFEGIGHVAKIYINEVLVTVHNGGYTAFTIDIEPYLIFDSVSEDKSYHERRGHKKGSVGQSDNPTLNQKNIITVVVDSRESNNLPPFGNVIDYLTYGGIYREVYLEIKEDIYIKDVFVQTYGVENKEKDLEFMIELNQYCQQNLRLIYSIQKAEDKNEDFIEARLGLNDTYYEKVSSVKKVTGEIERSVQIDQVVSKIHDKFTGVVNWDIDNPVLYELVLELYYEDGDKLLDQKVIRFGFRTCRFCEDGFYLNGKKIKLIGLNRHQSFPYVGYAMPKRIQKKDAEILKNELHVNVVRTSHYPQSKHFIDRCDELGLLVFTEIPGWQYIGDDEWKNIACEQVKEMILQYRNHPSIILWGVRINESQDNDELYLRTNQLAHELDSTRQTGGVRYLRKSSLLEDVYTYNDFLHNGKNKGLSDKKLVTLNRKVPYLVTEFNGHMFPTKSFDNEGHRLEHALRHARVLNEVFGYEDISGGIGWCMADYNTHKDFGSGDKICYHGVLDMFRNPKLAAAVYASQEDNEPVLELSSSMDIGEYPGGSIGDIYAFTNADSVKLYKNDIFIREFYPDRVNFDHLPHPPILIDDLVGGLLEEREHMNHRSAKMIKEVFAAIGRYGQNDLPVKYKLKMLWVMLKERLSMAEGVRLYTEYVGNWGGKVTSYKFEAIKNYEVVKVIEKKPVNQCKLKIQADSLELREEETYDVSGVRITVIDEYNNRVPYYQEAISLEAMGAIELIGPRVISLKGGAGGTYVRTNGIKGKGILKIRQENLEEIEIHFQVR